MGTGEEKKEAVKQPVVLLMQGTGVTQPRTIFEG